MGKCSKCGTETITVRKILKDYIIWKKFGEPLCPKCAEKNGYFGK